MSTEMDDGTLDALIHLGLPECVDTDALDHAELVGHARGLVPADVARRVETHLAACTHCAAVSSEHRAIARKAAARRNAARAVGAVLIAAAASIAFVVLLRPTDPVPAYRFAKVDGRLARTMSGGSTAELETRKWTFGPRAQIEIAVAPKDEHSSPVSLVAAAYVSRGGKLARLPERQLTRAGGEDHVVFHLRASTEEVFESCPGDTQLMVVIGSSAGELDRLSDRDWSQAASIAPHAQRLEATLRCEETAK